MIKKRELCNNDTKKRDPILIQFGFPAHRSHYRFPFVDIHINRKLPNLIVRLGNFRIAIRQFPVFALYIIIF